MDKIALPLTRNYEFRGSDVSRKQPHRDSGKSMYILPP